MVTRRGTLGQHRARASRDSRIARLARGRLSSRRLARIGRIRARLPRGERPRRTRPPARSLTLLHLLEAEWLDGSRDAPSVRIDPARVRSGVAIANDAPVWRARGRRQSVAALRTARLSPRSTALGSPAARPAA